MMRLLLLYEYVFSLTWTAVKTHHTQPKARASAESDLASNLMTPESTGKAC